MQSLSTQHIFKIIPGTAAAWSTATFSNTSTDAKYMPPHVVLFETDTRRLKVSDGVTTTYAALPYMVEETFTTAFKTLIDNAGLANGALVLNDSGLIDGQYVPAYIAANPSVVTNIAARDAIAVEDRTNIVVVRNASADATVGISETNAATRLLVHFDESVEDQSTYENTALVAGGSNAVYDFSSIPAKFGTAALTLNSNCIPFHFTEVAAGHAYTVELMYRRETTASTQSTAEYISQVFYQNAAGTERRALARIGISADGHTVFLQALNPSVTVLTDTVNINDGAYHRIAIRHTGSVISLYVDNRLVGSVAHAPLYGINLVSIGSGLQTGTSITAGTYTVTPTGYLHGAVDEFRIVNYDKFASDTSIPTAPFSVNDNAASYIWDDADEVWVKISEYESMDVDFTDFVKQGDEITRLIDGSTYVRFTVTERAQLAQMITDLAALATTEGNNYSAITARFDQIVLDQAAIDSRLDDLETTVADQDNHFLRDDEVVYFMSAPVSRFQ